MNSPITGVSFALSAGALYDYDYERIAGRITELATAGQDKELLKFMRFWCQESLFFLLYFILRVPVNHPFLVERIKEVQAVNDRTLDLWSREFFKCLRSDSVIWMADGSVKSLKDVEVGDWILGYENGQSVPVSVMAKTEPFKRYSFYVKLRSGRTVQCSSDHPFLTIDGFRKASELALGDFIAVPRTVCHVNNAASLTDAEARFIGYMIAEGSCTNGNCSFTNFDADVIAGFKSTCAELGFGVHDSERGCYKLSAGKSAPRQFIRQYKLDCLAIHKRVPVEIMQSNSSAVANFIAAYWACDGTVSSSTRLASCTSASKGLIDDVQVLLHRFGIYSSITEIKNDYAGAWVLSVTGQSNLANLCILCERKQKLLDDIIAEDPNGKDDPIPTGWERLLCKSVASRLYRNEGLRHAKGLFTSRKKVRRYAEVDCNDALKQLCDSDIKWDVITEIGSDGNEYDMYDIQVGGDNLFISDGVITHNSTIITYGLNIQHILTDPNERIGIFSHTRSIAKAFLRRIKLTLEGNDVLKWLFPDVLYENPGSQSPKWSEDEGLIVNRPSVFQECTVEAWGLTDSMPTSKHFSVLNYDDVVTVESVSTPAQIKKTSDCFRLSLNLGTDGGKKRIIGTIYHYADLHVELEKQGGWITRKRPAEDADGQPTFISAEKLAEKRRDQGPYVYNCQMLLSPTTKEDQRFKLEWLKWYRTPPARLNLYLLCDPSNEKKRKMTGGDYTVYWLWGVDQFENLFLVDVVRDKFTLTERWTELKRMRIRHPGIQFIGYEQYGMAADIQHFEEMMSIEGVYFHIEELAGTRLSKEDRISRIIPRFEQGRIYLPEHLFYTDKDGKQLDLIRVFVDEEYLKFPFAKHDDMLDAASRIEDKKVGLVAPDDSVDDDYVESYGLSGYFNSAGFEGAVAGRCPVTGY